MLAWIARCSVCFVYALKSYSVVISFNTPLGLDQCHSSMKGLHIAPQPVHLGADNEFKSEGSASQHLVRREQLSNDAAADSFVYFTTLHGTVAPQLT